MYSGVLFFLFITLLTVDLCVPTRVEDVTVVPVVVADVLAVGVKIIVTTIVLLHVAVAPQCVETKSA